MMHDQISRNIVVWGMRNLFGYIVT